ncbi:MAG: transglutaminaseTgpA domain-containing protein, partial [Candidatus Promineifilaceae bacterium]|nr:transglutaminaseTgpA domain-containing protein [Candidatus Promineifilaceae bacterium]
MLLDALHWFAARFRPAGGWLPFLLLFAAVGALAVSVADAEWLPEVVVVLWAAPLGLLMGTILAQRSLRGRIAWLLLGGYALGFTFFYLGRLAPPLSLVLDGRGGPYFRHQLALLADRYRQWLLGAGGGDAETILFASGLTLLAWLVPAAAAWLIYRRQRPLVALGLLGLFLAVNDYFAAGHGSPWAAPLFVGLALLLLAVLDFRERQDSWQLRSIDFSEEIRPELLATAAAIAGGLAVLSLMAPSVGAGALARAFAATPAVRYAEGWLTRVTGIETPGSRNAAAPGGYGTLPRTFLIGNPPSLHETVVMTATLHPASPHARHWRGASYDVYTGHGWTLSPETREPLPAGEPLPLDLHLDAGATFSQTINWRYDDRTLRYTIGLPLRLDHAAAAYWRTPADLSRVHGQRPAPRRYHARSYLPTPSAARLRQSRREEIPAAHLVHYTQLPADVPARVLELARAVGGEAATPYDQARALEAFLRQYPYTLDVPPPPAVHDPVDYFLFELQRGYCDYYASSMVVMARALGLPARLVSGYLASPPDEEGVQTIYQIQAHAWTEIYFAGVGWIAFEPTAPFPTPDAQREVEAVGAAGIPPAPPPIPAPPSVAVSLERGTLAGLI